MKFATISKCLVLGLALLLTSSAFAANKGSLQLVSSVMVNGTTLRPGDYKVQWDGSGPDVELNILQGKNVVAKAQAHVVELRVAASNDAAVTRRSDSGPSLLAGIRFEGRKLALDLGAAAGGTQGEASSK